VRLRIALRRARRIRNARASALCLVALFASGALAALGCGWIGTEHSVRFNRWHGERRFSRLPSLPFDARRKTKTSYEDEDYDEEAERQSEEAGKKADALWAQASDAAREGDLARLRTLLRDYRTEAEAAVCKGYGSPVNCKSRLKSASDTLDALASLEHGARAESVSAYVRARTLYDLWLEGSQVRDKAAGGNAEGSNGQAAGGENDSEESTKGAEEKSAGGSEKGEAESTGPPTTEQVLAAISRVPRDAELEDNVAYLRGAVLFHGDREEEAARAFEELASRFPRSEKREAALYTVAVIRLHASASFTGEDATAGKACPECRDESWEAAVRAFSRVLKEYPRGQFAADARGWIAYLHLRVGETAAGLADYYRMLADDSDEATRSEALVSLSLSRGHATDEDMARVESLIEGEPRVALTYAYHDIYNYAFGGHSYVEIPEEENPYRYEKEHNINDGYRQYYEWEEKERQRRTEKAENVELARVAAFATRMMRRYPRADVGGGFALRVAQADLELGDNRAARELATRALSSGLRDNERAAALWVEGVAEYRLKDFTSARRTLARLVSEFPGGDLTEGARRLLAMAAEDAGDLDGALEQYIALDYTSDVAYFVDVLMTPEQLASFIEHHADSPRRDMLLYSLGVRYLRAHRFDEARAAYARVKVSDSFATGLYFYVDEKCLKDWRTARFGCANPKEPDDEKAGEVRARWVVRDVLTMDEIERLEAGVKRAAGDEAKAEALYQLASYYYGSSDLTFYNPAAWRGGRFYALYYDQQMRAPGEAQLMRRYMEEHEPLVRALNVYLEAARLYPRTRAARDSLYTAAVIHERLASFLLYWPSQYQLGIPPGDRMVTYDDVRRTCPSYQLPRGTLRWEPLTRTVNGGPGWDEAPRRKPLTGMERARLKIRRAELKLSKGWELFGEIGGGRVRRWALAALRWSLFALVGACVLLVFRRTRRARRFLYRQVVRRGGPRRSPEPYAPKSSYAAHLSHTRGGSLRDAAGETAHRLLRLAAHERGRAALALNLLTHGLLTLLLWAALWATKG
jgi:outer membrane protein assembly factor BamD (BamD/ComL family)